MPETTRSSSEGASLAPLEDLPIQMLEAARCHLGEGPAYDVASHTAWWFDILEKRLHEADLTSGAVKVHALPVMASGLAFLEDGRQLLVAEDGLYLRHPETGALTLHCAMPESAVPSRSNDARVHPSGTLWFSMMGRSAELGQGSIHALHDGRIETLVTGITIPNAICFSPDGATGYFSDTRENRLTRVALDPTTGLPLGQPELFLKHDGPGGLDGAVTDAEGNIWCAHWGGGCVQAYSPDGTPLRRIALPARQTSCPVFVGPGFASLLVTSAFEGMDDAAQASDPHSGRTFLIDLGVAGKAEPRVKLGVR